MISNDFPRFPADFPPISRRRHPAALCGLLTDVLVPDEGGFLEQASAEELAHLGEGEGPHVGRLVVEVIPLCRVIVCCERRERRHREI